MNDLDFLQMEEPKAILKYFRTLSEKENEDIILTDKELSFCGKNNWNRSFENDLQKSRVSFPYVLFPLQEEEISSDSDWDVANKEAGSDINMTEEERNIINLMKQQAGAVNPGSGLCNCPTNQQLNKLQEERCDKVNGHSKEGGRILPDEPASDESPQAKCQHMSTEGTCAVCDCAAQIKLDDSAESIEGEEMEFGKVYLKKEWKNGPGVQHEMSVNRRERNTMPLTETTAEELEDSAEKQELEQTEDTFFKNVSQTKTDEEEEDDEEDKDIFLCSPARSLHPYNLKDSFHHISITPATFSNNPPPGLTFSRSTFSPNSPTEKQVQLPALFSGLRVLRKGVVGPEHDTVALIGSSSQRTKGESLLDLPAQGGFLEQISTFLSRDKRTDENEVKVVEGSLGEKDEDGARTGGEIEGGGCPELAKPAVSSAEAAFDAFKAFFTPKPLKKDPTEKVDLETLKRRIKADRDALKALFDRTSIKIPASEDSADCKVGYEVDVVGLNYKVNAILLILSVLFFQFITLPLRFFSKTKKLRKYFSVDFNLLSNLLLPCVFSLKHAVQAMERSELLVDCKPCGRH